MKKLGRHLAELRKSNGLKQKELAKALSVSQQIISNIERDQTTPDIELLKRMADFYGISLDQLVGRTFNQINEDDVENRIINYLKQMDDRGKELSLGRVSQVVQHQGINNGKN